MTVIEGDSGLLVIDALKPAFVWSESARSSAVSRSVNGGNGKAMDASRSGFQMLSMMRNIVDWVGIDARSRSN